MAERPVFIPAPEAPGLVREKSLVISWAGGFAAVQKKKNVHALHNAAAALGYTPILEASTKSDEKLGQHLSAFHLKVKSTKGDIPLECAYQGSKVFERGGPYTDLYFTDARSAKRDQRLQESGKLIAFVFEEHSFPLEPKSVFYDWLYITAIFPHHKWLERLFRYAGFSDIEFNPQKSINCQARSCALFVSLKKTDLLEEAVRSPESFISMMKQYAKRGVASTPHVATEISSELLEATDAIQQTPLIPSRIEPEQPQASQQDDGLSVSASPSEEVSLNTTAPSDTVKNTTQEDDSTLKAKVPAPNFELFLLEKRARKTKREKSQSGPNLKGRLRGKTSRHTNSISKTTLPS